MKYEVRITLFGAQNEQTVMEFERLGFIVVVDMFQGSDGRTIQKTMLCRPVEG